MRVLYEPDDRTFPKYGHDRESLRAIYTDRELIDAQSLFDYSMALNDARFDESYKYIIYQDNGPWSVRFTSWYVPGLLYRNKGNDLDNAKEAITNMRVSSVWFSNFYTNKINSLANQMTDNFTAPWYGTWKLSPDGENISFPICDRIDPSLEPNPTPNSPLYTPVIYVSQRRKPLEDTRLTPRRAHMIPTGENLLEHSSFKLWRSFPISLAHSW